LVVQPFITCVFVAPYSEGHDTEATVAREMCQTHEQVEIEAVLRTGPERTPARTNRNVKAVQSLRIRSQLHHLDPFDVELPGYTWREDSRRNRGFSPARRPSILLRAPDPAADAGYQAGHDRSAEIGDPAGY
jgi:hypothetical protein